jgi:hypothetical protein
MILRRVYQQRTTDWIDAIHTAGSDVEWSSAEAVNNFVYRIRLLGFSSQLKRVNVLAGLDLSAALACLWDDIGTANSDTNVAFVNADYAENTGLAMDTTNKYLRTGAAVNSLSSTSHHHGMYVCDNFKSERCGLGAYSSTVATFLLWCPYSTDTVYSDSYSTGTGRVNSGSGLTGSVAWIFGQRLGNYHEIRRNTTTLAFNNTTGGSADSREMWVGCYNAAGFPMPSPGSYVMGGYSFGTDLTAGTDADDYYTEWQRLQTRLGRAV